MIKKALKSKYIRNFLVGLIVFSAVLIGMTLTVGKDVWNTKDWDTYRYELWEKYGTVGWEETHESGNYKYVMTKDGQASITDMNRNVLYESDESFSMMPKEGYVQTQNEQDKMILFNFYTDETEWTQTDSEYVRDYIYEYWQMVNYEYEISDDIMNVYYLMEDDYSIGMDGMLFAELTEGEDFIAGWRIIGHNYKNMAELDGAKREDLQLESVLIKDGEVIYSCPEYIWEVERVNNNKVKFYSMEDEVYRYVSLAPETLGQVVEVARDDEY